MEIHCRFIKPNCEDKNHQVYTHMRIFCIYIHDCTQIHTRPHKSAISSFQEIIEMCFIYLQGWFHSPREHRWPRSLGADRGCMKVRTFLWVCSLLTSWEKKHVMAEQHIGGSMCLQRCPQEIPSWQRQNFTKKALAAPPMFFLLTKDTTVPPSCFLLAHKNKLAPVY